MAGSGASSVRGLWILLGLTLGLGVSSILLAGALPSERAESWQAADVLPAGTLIHLSLSGTPCVERASGLAIARLFREKEVQEFLAPVQVQVNRFLETMDRRLQQTAQVKLEEVAALADSTLSLSLVGLRERLVDHGDYKEERIEPQLVLMLDFGEDLETVRKLVAAGESMAQRMGIGEVEEVKLEGTAVRRLAIPMGAGHEIHQVIQGDHLLASNCSESLAAVLQRLRTQQPRDNLAHQAVYGEVQRRVARPGTIMSVYANVAGIVEAFRSEISEEFLPLVELSGLGGMQAVGYGCDIEGTGFRDRFYLHMPSPQGLFATVFPRDARVQGHALAPKAAPCFFAGTCSWPALLDWIEQVLVAVEPGAARFVQAMVQRADAGLGMSLRDDVLEALGPEFGMFASFPRYGLIPEPVAYVSVKDRKKITAALDALTEILGEQVEVQSLDYLGHRLHYVSLDTWDASPVDIPPIKPTWSLVGDHLVMSLWPQAIKHLVRGRRAQEPRLATREEFAGLLQTLRREDARAGTAKLFYFDLPRCVGFLCDNGVPFLQSAVPALPGIEIEWAAFPLTDTLTKHLFDIGGGSHWTEKGGYSEVISPTGLLPALVAFGGGAVLVPRRVAMPPRPR